MSDTKTELDATQVRFGLVAARFNGTIVERLVDGALGFLRDHGASDESLLLVRVPGAWEIPTALYVLAGSGRVDALVALGAVIRGETSHFEYISTECAAGCARVTAESGIAVGFGVLTCENVSQAMARAGGRAGNKGVEAAEAALEMVHLQRAFR